MSMPEQLTPFDEMQRRQARDAALRMIGQQPGLTPAIVELARVTRDEPIDQKRQYLQTVTRNSPKPAADRLLCLNGWLGVRPCAREEYEFFAYEMESSDLRQLPGSVSDMVHRYIAGIALDFGDFKRAEVHARANPASANSPLLLSEALYGLGRFDEVVGFDFHSLQWSDDEVGRCQVAVDLRKIANITVSGPPIVLVCVDGVYFQEFAVAELLSLHETTPDLEIHLHVMDPLPTTERLLEGLKSKCNGRRITVTSEQVARRDADYLKLHYCCMRFVWAAALARHLDRTVIVTDADVLFRRDMRTYLKAAEGYDVALVE